MSSQKEGRHPATSAGRTGGTTHPNRSSSAALGNERTAKLAAINRAERLGYAFILLHGLRANGDCTCHRGAECPPRNRGKHPVNRDWETNPIDYQNLRAWVVAEPDHNLGWRMGVQPSGKDLLALDIDSDATFAAISELERTLGELPTSCVQRSGSGGWHLIVEADSALFRNAVKADGIGLDFRSVGGQIVAAPSRNASGAYELVADGEPDVLPRAWVEHLAALQAQGDAPKAVPAARTGTADAQTVAWATEWLRERAPVATEGKGGHNALMVVFGGLLVGFELDDETAYELAVEHYNPRCEPPWQSPDLEKDFGHKIEQIHAHGSSTFEPRQLLHAWHDAAVERAAREHPPAGEPAYPSEDYTKLRLNPLTGWPWILQKAGFFWLHEIDQAAYRQEVPTAELMPSVARHLDKQIAEEDRTKKRIDNRFVRPVSTLRSTYTARAHTYDPKTNTLTLAALRWTQRQATFHPHIDAWLRALFGSSYRAAAQWIASLNDLSRPAPCLYLAGPAQLGKSLLASGLAQVWSLMQPAPLSEAIATFNEATGTCPLIFGDEGFPPELNFNDFREMITAHARRVDMKYRAKVTVEGCGRFLLCANNDDALRYQKTGTLTKADLDAIADRLLVIVCDESARTEVAKLDTDAAAGHEIAEHALWLAETVPLQPKGQRMCAAPGGGERILANVMNGRHAEILLTVRLILETCDPPWACGVWNPTFEPAATYVNVTKLFAALPQGHRTSLADIREFCSTHQLRAGAEQRKTPKAGEGGTNLTCRVLNRDTLKEALDALD